MKVTSLKTSKGEVMDLKKFVPLFFNYSSKNYSTNSNKYQKWIKWGKERLEKYPVCLPEYWLNEKDVNAYCFIDELSKYTEENEIIVCADGTACVTTFQAIKVKKNSSNS